MKVSEKIKILENEIKTLEFLIKISDGEKLLLRENELAKRKKELNKLKEYPINDIVIFADETHIITLN